MKIFFCTILLAIFFGLPAYSQYEVQLATTDSTIGKYLENSVKDTTVLDSCVTGIYYIKFILNAEGNIHSYTCSKKMPDSYKKIFKKKLDILNKKWDKKFLDYVTRQKIVLLQPMLFNVNNDCFIQENYYTKKMDSSENPNDQKTLTDKAIIYGLSRDIFTMQQSFLTAADFDNNKSLKNGSKLLMLSPCIITRVKSGRNYYR